MDRYCEYCDYLTGSCDCDDCLIDDTACTPTVEVFRTVEEFRMRNMRHEGS